MSEPIFVDAETPIHPLTVDQFDRMVELGLFKEDDRVELLEGVLVEMNPEGPAHADLHSRLVEHFAETARRSGFTVRAANPYRAEDISQPEPDIALVERRRYPTGHPRSAYLVIEISDSSLGIDRIRKARIYARSGVPEYWIVDVSGRQVEVRRSPVGDEYQDVRVVGPGGSIAPAHVQAPPVAVDELFAAA